MFLPHTITVYKVSVVSVSWETRYERQPWVFFDAMVYKAPKSSLNDTDLSRDTDKWWYAVIVDLNDDTITIDEWDIVVPNMWWWDMWEFVVSMMMNNYAYTKDIENVYFHIQRR